MQLALTNLHKLCSKALKWIQIASTWPPRRQSILLWREISWSWITILLYVREGLADAAIFMYACADSAAVMLLFRPRALGRKDGWLVQLAQTWTLTKNDAGPLVSTRQIYIATGEQGWYIYIYIYIYIWLRLYLFQKSENLRVGRFTVGSSRFLSVEMLVL